MIKVDLYARISDAAEGDAFGVTNQLEAMRKHAADKGWEVGTEYVDNSVSATKGTRPQFQAILGRRVRRPVLAYNWDRFIRVSKDLIAVVDLSLEVHFVISPPVDLSTVNGRLIATVLTGVATAEIETKRERALLANQARAADGLPYWRRRPYGHTLDGQIMPQEADVLRWVAREVIDGVSLRKLSRVLAEEHGVEWTAANLGKKLKSGRLAGRLTYQGQQMPESRIQPILDESTWIQLQSILENPERKTSKVIGGAVSSLLSAIAKCGICDDGTTMHAGSVHRNGSNTPAYRCRTKLHCAHARGVTDEHVSRQTVIMLTTGEVSDLVDDPAHDDSATVEEVKAIQAQLEEWQEVASEMGPREYIAVTRPLKARLTELDEQMKEQSRASVVGDFLIGDEFKWSHYADAMDKWRALPLMRQREIVGALWDITLLRRSRTDKGFVPELVRMERR